MRTVWRPGTRTRVRVGKSGAPRWINFMEHDTIIRRVVGGEGGGGGGGPQMGFCIRHIVVVGVVVMWLVVECGSFYYARDERATDH